MVSNFGYWVEKNILRTTEMPAGEGEPKSGATLGFVTSFLGVFHR